MMDRRTLLAVILSVIVITVGFSISAVFQRRAAEEAALAQGTGTESTAVVDGTASTGTDGTASSGTSTTDTQVTDSVPATPAAATPVGSVLAVPEEGIPRDTRVYRNDLIEVVFDPVGGSVDHYRLLSHLDNGEPVDMLFTGADDQRAFTLHFGDYTTAPVTDLFRYSRPRDNVIEFSRDFYVVGQEDKPFTIVKRFTFQPEEYLFKMEVEVTNSVNEVIPLSFGGTAYTIGYGPQIGPAFDKLDNRTEFRRYIVYDDGKRNAARVSEGNPEITDDRVSWVALAGKYFAVIAVTDGRELTTALTQEPREGIPTGSQLYVSRPAFTASSDTDEFYFYVGPKNQRVLDRYDNAEDNAWGRSDLDLAKVQESRRLLGWLENILKWVLELIYRLIPNYGVAIIITTIFVKLLLWPLMRKSYQSTARMQAINPKVQELREKYKDDQQKMNAEMAALYKKEGVSPLGGCLPMLGQFPFFLAMYGLFNNHFDLRGAVFIPGWITDLSAPEYIFQWEGGFSIPLIGQAIRLLPIIFVGTQLLSTKLTQTPQANQSNMQMKLMQYGLPIVFFFILYNVPSGLLVYWIFSNIFTAGQQYYYNKIKKQKAPPPEPVKKKRVLPPSAGPKKKKR